MTAFGIYDSFTYSQNRTGLFPTAGERFRAMRDAGLSVVLNYGTGSMSAEENVRYANEASAIGVQVIWNLWSSPNTWRGDYIDAVKNHPSTWGFYVGDEAQPGSGEAAQVYACAAHVKNTTNKKSLYVSRPGERVLKPFTQIATHVGPDCYPIGVPRGWAKGDPRVGVVANWASKLVRPKVRRWRRRKLAMVLQAFSWSVDYPDQPSLPWPDADTMYAMKRVAIHRGKPDMILWFCMHCITDYHPDPAGYWAQFASIAS